MTDNIHIDTRSRKYTITIVSSLETRVLEVNKRNTVYKVYKIMNTLIYQRETKKHSKGLNMYSERMNYSDQSDTTCWMYDVGEATAELSEIEEIERELQGEK